MDLTTMLVFLETFSYCFLIGGFFSELLGTVAKVAVPLLGGTAVGAGISALLGGDETVTKVGTGADIAALRGQPLISSAALAALGPVVGGAACPPTTGGLRKRTIVQTFCPSSGKVFKQEMFAGGVAIRASDVAAAKRVFRQVSKLSQKMPRKTVKESPIKQLTDRVVKNALEKAGDNGNGCP